MTKGMTYESIQGYLLTGWVVKRLAWPPHHTLRKAVVQGREVAQASPGLVLKAADLSAEDWVPVAQLDS
jgi:hypothetical protein